MQTISKLTAELGLTSRPESNLLDRVSRSLNAACQRGIRENDAAEPVGIFHVYDRNHAMEVLDSRECQVLVAHGFQIAHQNFDDTQLFEEHLPVFVSAAVGLNDLPYQAVRG